MATPSTPNTNALKPYVAGKFPAVNTQDVERFLQVELQKIANAMNLVNQVLKEHEARLASGGL